MFFCYDGESFETYESEDVAKAAAETSLEFYQDQAPDGWPEESLNVCWGVIKQDVQITSERPVTEEDDLPDFGTFQTRELVDCNPESNEPSLSRKPSAPCGCAWRSLTIARTFRILFPTVYADCKCNACNATWTERFEFDFSIPSNGSTYEQQTYAKG